MDIIDNYTDAVWAIPLKSKDEAFIRLKTWELTRENETGHKVGTYITDRGELKSDKMKDWLDSRGTQQRLTAPYTSAHNGRVERLHRTLMAKAWTMCIYARCPANLWDKFYMTAAYLHMRTVTGSTKMSTPWE